MSANDRQGLVARMRAALGDPETLDLPLLPPDASATARRSALALRIIALERTPAQPLLPQVATDVDAVTTAPAPEPVIEPVIVVPPKPRKPPRVSMTTVRLEDAASLLASVDAEPAPPPAAMGRGAAAMMAAAASMAALQAADDIGTPGTSDPFSAFGDDAT